MNRIKFILLFVLVFLCHTDTYAQKDTIVVGRVSSDAKKHYSRFKPFADYLAKRLGDSGIKKGNVVLPKNNAQMVEYIKDGKIDIITETIYSSMFYIKETGVIPLLRRWKKGFPVYHSVIFARKDSGIKSLSDLKGKIVALEDPGSTSGYFLPKGAFLSKGIKMVELKSLHETPSPDTVGYVFTRGEMNIGHWVYKGMADAGAFSNIDYDFPTRFPAEYMDKLMIVHRTQEVPSNLILVRPGLDSDLVEKIKKILIDMKNNEEGTKIMFNFSRTSAFDEFPEGIDKIFDSLGDLYDLVASE
ncbi:MAG: phosphate/phosphite/phosphonate ABC transporter substrate-binding protein [Candidatus Omnitrophota bacterium]